MIHGWLRVHLLAFLTSDDDGLDGHPKVRTPVNRDREIPTILKSSTFSFVGRGTPPLSTFSSVDTELVVLGVHLLISLDSLSSAVYSLGLSVYHHKPCVRLPVTVVSKNSSPYNTSFLKLFTFIEVDNRL